MVNEKLQVENGNYTRIVNDSLEALIKQPLLGAEFAIVLFVIRKTWGYGKTSDKISLSQIQEGTNISRPTIVKALKNLQLVNILQLVKAGTHINNGTEWKFNKNHKEWSLVNRYQLVKGRAKTGKPVFQKLVKTGKHTKEIKENTKEISKSSFSKEKVLPKSKKKNYDDPLPLSLPEFVEKMRQSPQRHMRIIAEYADEIKCQFTKKGQWLRFIDRNVRQARNLVGYTDDQISDAFEELQKNLKTKENPKGYITKWSLETIEKFI